MESVFMLVSTFSTRSHQCAWVYVVVSSVVGASLYISVHVSMHRPESRVGENKGESSFRGVFLQYLTLEGFQPAPPPPSFVFTIMRFPPLHSSECKTRERFEPSSQLFSFLASMFENTLLLRNVSQ